MGHLTYFLLLYVTVETPYINDTSVRDSTRFEILILAAYSDKREIGFPKSQRDAAAVKIGQLSNDYNISSK